MDNDDLIAHVKQNPDGSWAAPQSLEAHLRGTAELAGTFARSFGSETWGRAAGMAHDAGKATAKWQEYLRRKSGYDSEAHLENLPGKVGHSAPGAKLAEEVFEKGCGRILSYCIAGHHAGLPDWMGSQSALAFRLQQTKIDDIAEEISFEARQNPPGNPPWSFSRGMDISLWIRMLFSCLVDADFLDTEKYMDSGKQKDRGGYLPMKALLCRLDAYMEKLTKGAPDTEVNRVRQAVLSDCWEAALETPGFFSLTVPTGGGKTLSSMAFALKHAEHYKKDRIVYVIPYTSIIEQNADVFRKAIGDDQVVEHHSNLNEEDVTDKARLATENWDAPVIVTTSVQFFESLFAAKTSRCRKLHNICNSVVVLDEAQMLPVEFLSPILQTMELLVKHYGVSFVICTATQPALEKQDDFPGFPGIPRNNIREIIRDVPSLYRKLKRVQVMVPKDLKAPSSLEEVAETLKACESVLCIVSDRRTCRDLFHLMPEGTYHLSALMCAEHRSDTIAKIKADLNAGKPTRVISTQLVEAGVDLDFPVVFRAMAGLDSIAQAAGRCNREGKLESGLGKVVVFIPPKKSPPGILRKATETAVRLLSEGLPDPIDQCVFPPYFSELYWKANTLDKKEIVKQLSPGDDLGIRFRSAADDFKLIDDTMQRSILVPYGEGANWIDTLKRQGPERWLLRKLQRYIVNIYTPDFNALLHRGSIAEISSGIYALLCPIEYDQKTGLKVDDSETGILMS